MAKALEGFRIADFSHVMAGPFASHMLRLLGAEVVKVEAPDGDPMRYYGDDPRYHGMAPGFIAANAGKKSIVIDLKKREGHEIATRLIASCDVVLENFRPGVMAKFGLGYESCKALRADIIYCSVSGYGQKGVLSHYPAIDNIVQASSGMMSLSGEPGDPPMRVGFPVIDTYVGTLATLAITAALLQRERSGGPQLIDVAMLDASLVLMASAVVPYLVTGQSIARTGNTGYSGQPTAGTFEAKDGTLISLGVVQPVQYEALCRVLERPDLLTDPRFTTPALRKQNAAALRAVLAIELTKRPGAEWERVLSETGVPCGLVRDLKAVLEHPHLDDREIKQEVCIPSLPGRTQVQVLNAGFRFETDGPGVADPPPRLGEHTDAILESLGFSSEERARLRASSVVA
jgi:crotonobetainyl-CoA:carnitine CoA-transferase CaiB-like acyl-CoA transferase